MKNSLLCVLCLLLAETIAHAPTETIEFIQSTITDTSALIGSFDAHAFLKLMEEYTQFTKTAPKRVSEKLAIKDLVERLTQETAQIEKEIKNTKLHGALPKKLEDRLKQCNDSAKTALRELHKRENLVEILAQNSPEYSEPIPQVPATLLGSTKLNASYQFVKNIFPAKTNLKENLAETPYLTNC